MEAWNPGSLESGNPEIREAGKPGSLEAWNLEIREIGIRETEVQS